MLGDYDCFFHLSRKLFKALMTAHLPDWKKQEGPASERLILPPRIFEYFKVTL